MRVTKDRVVSMDYTIRLVTGEVIETSLGSEPLLYLHGRRQIVPGVERAVEGMSAGETAAFELEPSEAFGVRDPTGVFLVPRAAFPDGEPLGKGMSFSAERPDGSRFDFRVLEVADELILVDTNHPLAGQALQVAVSVHQVRGATAEELTSGRPMTAEVSESPYLA